MIKPALIWSGMARWLRDESATAATEAGLLFPVLMVMIVGLYDVGNGILANQKAITASQVVADLIARGKNVTDSQIDEAIEAGRLAMQPFDTSGYGIDIASIRFDEQQDPQVLWRVTENTAANVSAVDSTAGLGAEGEGMVIVTIDYPYVPAFAGYIINTIQMKEVAFVRGRKSSTVGKI